MRMRGAWLAVAALPIVLVWATLGAAILAANIDGQAGGPAPGSVDDIPSEYLSAYVASAARFELGSDGWSYLAAIGKVESDHGRSTAPGVSSGQNTHGCCAGPMQIHNGFGTGGATWGAYRVDGDADGKMDIYSPADAVATGARYLQASGAPGDWRKAVFAYNHDDAYVDRVLQQATAYRDAASQSSAPGAAPSTSLVAGDGAWLAEIPGMPGERCDQRIVADVLMLIAEFGVHVSDCYGGAPHARDGEHPLGLATDIVPSDGDWGRTMRLARTYGWAPECASTGCAGRGPFRVVLYNGYPGHGDPRYSRVPHLHISWLHAPAEPFTRARWVRVLDPSTAVRQGRSR
jgi:hypothetical protein